MSKNAFLISRLEHELSYLKYLLLLCIKYVYEVFEYCIELYCRS